ncbi:hypothetical protein ACZ87_02976 [Candidatus Erwinia dacicola]|uniref:Uncharacterized protein n=1 Tax=Candidatus Erwinia dacicola TaxID=252393 RepID=A0A328TLJ4_9GAMM|nr:hypothetical protein ACZ87_02976 [Candidatus Erwinia dacicola]
MLAVFMGLQHNLYLFSKALLRVKKGGRGSVLFSHYPGESMPQDQSFKSEFFLRYTPDWTSF